MRRSRILRWTIGLAGVGSLLLVVGYVLYVMVLFLLHIVVVFLERMGRS